MRCDCGEQLDEAIRLISQPIAIPATSLSGSPSTVPGRGTTIYLRQEGRGIGLLSKIRAYNLQDLGHDTVTANLMLGHQADERGYEIAGAILRDLGLGGEAEHKGVRVLTNNSDKVEALQREGLKIVERVPMVSRSWQSRQENETGTEKSKREKLAPAKDIEHSTSVTLFGGNRVYSDDLDKYLQTKITKMGHILPLWEEKREATLLEITA